MNIKKRSGILSLLSIIFLLTAMATRIMIFVQTPADSGLTATLFAKAFATGLLFDLAALSYFLIPVGLYLILAPKRVTSQRYHHLFIRLGFLVFIGTLLFNGVAEYLFFDEFSTRFNFIAVDYLVYTHEVIGDITESYPVTPLLCAIFSAALCITFMIRRTIDQACVITFGYPQRRLLGLASLTLPLAAFLFISISASDISKNDYADEIAQNGIYSLFAAFRNNELDYSRFYLTDNDHTVMSNLRSIIAEKDEPFTSSDGITRHIINKSPEKKLNVIVLVEESLSASFLGCLGNNRGLTPNLDRLSQQSILFTNVYATGTRTVRGLEALSISMPPLPGISIIKRPDNKGFRSWGKIMRDDHYDTKYIYAGYGYFDNMNDYFAHNSYDVVDRSNFSKDEISFATIWGVCDEDLFDKVIKESGKSFDAGKPFFSTVMTTSNHKPFEFPSGKIDIPSKTGGRNGGVEYADYAIGRFINKASKAPWFKDTVFVIVADHCASSAGKTELPAKKYEIPLLIYSPGNIKPAHVDTMMSQIDIPPTVLGLLNISYTSDFFGRDILKPSQKPGRAFISTYQKLGYIENDRIGVLAPQKKVTLYTFDRQSGEERQGLVDSRFMETMLTYYQGSNYIYKNNLNRIK